MKIRIMVIAILSIVIDGPTFAASTNAKNKLSCRTNATVFSVSPNGADSYDITLSNPQFASQFSVESLRKMFPTMDEKMLQGLAAQAAKDAVGSDSLGDCANMKTCTFSEVGSSNLVTCNSKIDDRTSRTLSVDLIDGVYKVKCTSVGNVESHTQGLDFKGSKSVTSTFQASIEPASCSYE